MVYKKVFYFTGYIVYCNWFVGINHSRFVTNKTRGRGGRVTFYEAIVRLRKP